MAAVHRAFNSNRHEAEALNGRRDGVLHLEFVYKRIEGDIVRIAEFQVQMRWAGAARSAPGYEFAPADGNFSFPEPKVHAVAPACPLCPLYAPVEPGCETCQVGVNHNAAVS